MAVKGRVTSFDRESGLGEVSADGTGTFPFHCTEITDGTREIAVGTEVDFCPAPGHLGRWEARAVAQAHR